MNDGLPITEVLADICQHLANNDELVLQAPPGAGKTTVVPLELLKQPWLNKPKILLLEPRRMAARAAAERMAQLLGEPVGKTVGYRMRLQSKVSAETRIEVITEGILTRMLQDDPSLDGVGLVIFDEFHERSLDADLGLTLALQGRELFRDQQQSLKVLVMSATLDGERVAQLLGDAPIVTSQGRSYPVDIVYGRNHKAGDPIEPLVVATVMRALSETSGSLLVFLPGQGEINRVASSLRERLVDRDDVVLAPLYGSLSLEQQRSAIEPCGTGVRKVVLSTNIAETSITIDGISTVVDSGLAREPQFDPNSGMTRLRTRRISKASSVQRAGRAGRLGPGRCYRLWSDQQQQQLAAHATPEILQADLAPMVLQLLAWGVGDASELQWLDAPPGGPWQQALELLAAFAAIERTNNGSWQLTPHGQRMAATPCHPRLANMLLLSEQWGLQKSASDLAALLSERTPVTCGANLIDALVLLSSSGCPPTLKGWQQRVREQSRRFLAICKDTQTKGTQTDAPVDAHMAPGLLLGMAYPDRIARHKSGDSYQLSNGRRARLSGQGNLQGEPWLVVADLGGQAGSAEDRIYTAVPLSEALFDSHLCGLLKTEDKAHWDDRSQQFVAQRQQRVGAILLNSRPLDTIDPQQKTAALLDLVRKQGLQLLPWTKALEQWRHRVLLLHRTIGDPWPDLSDDALLNSLEGWLAPYLEPVTRLSHFQQLDLKAILANLLPWPLPQQLDELAPVTLPVPSGSNITVDYSQSPPVLAVKLQEMFGCQQTPTVAGGRVPLTVHLLSPARRPLQITQDLAGFWHSSYQQVKKEMKGRYPKHPWPDDPLQALPTARVKKRL
ncbi:ATP-dependent helicase HrpB [Porticoccus sp. W117]|uniref:ATP-dependent helicase HrpB n=1 Tax=Porticoccus sp. W117 TaxID=3054777 RepID=UPI0025983F94|nr:ATP-dependent helicase HrpB [Porticoccus sp. W117]MDM3870327.1 ATP-dependent helicase HrpB [Porticoccus sp. W117]